MTSKFAHHINPSRPFYHVILIDRTVQSPALPRRLLGLIVAPSALHSLLPLMASLEVFFFLIISSLLTLCASADEVIECLPQLGTGIAHADCIEAHNRARVVETNAHPRQNMEFRRGTSGNNNLPWGELHGSCAIAVDLEGSGAPIIGGTWKDHVDRLQQLIDKCAPNSVEASGTGGIFQIDGFQYLILNPRLLSTRLPPCFKRLPTPDEDVFHCLVPTADELLMNQSLLISSTLTISSAPAISSTLAISSAPTISSTPATLSSLVAQVNVSSTQTVTTQQAGAPVTTLGLSLPRPPMPEESQIVRVSTLPLRSHQRLRDIKGSFQLVNGNWEINDSWRDWDKPYSRLLKTEDYFLLQGDRQSRPAWPTGIPVPHPEGAFLELGWNDHDYMEYRVGGAWISDENNENWIPQSGVVGSRHKKGTISRFRGGGRRDWRSSSRWFLLRGSPVQLQDSDDPDQLQDSDAESLLEDSADASGFEEPIEVD